MEYEKKGMIGIVHTIIVISQNQFNNQAWRTNAKMMSGGALIDGGIHFIEALLDLHRKHQPP